MRGRFGPFGGQYVPETLMGALQELEDAATPLSAVPPPCMRPHDWASTSAARTST